MTATYGAIGRTDYGVRTNTLAPVPAGTANGDLLILVAVTGNATQVAVSLPAGFTQIGSAQSGADGSGFDWYAVMGYRIASSEPASYTCTHASAGCETMMVRIDGAGTLSVDVFSQAVHVGDTGTSTATSVTPTAADDLLLFVSLNWDEAALTPPTGMTERQDAQFIYLATQALASSSATGTRTQTHSNSPWFANLIAIKDAVAGGTTLTADAGSYTLTGTSAGVAGRAILDAGSYALTGTSADFAIATPWTPALIAADMHSWFKADALVGANGSAVGVTIPDSGPDGRHYTYAGGGTSGAILYTNAQNGLNVAFFDGAAYLCGDSQFSDFAVYAVWSGFDNTGNNPRILDHNYANGFWMGRSVPPNSFGGGIKHTWDPYGNFLSDVDTGWHITVFGRVGTAGRVRDNGGTREITQTVDGVVTGPYPVYLATENTFVAVAGNLTLCELLILDANVEANLEKIEGYLAWKWGLQANLPSGHPYKSAAPTISGGTTLTCAADSYAITGTAAVLRCTHATAAGAYALTGTAAAFAYKQTVAAGSYSLTGTAAGLNVTANLVFSAAAGAYTLTGTAAGLNVSGNLVFPAVAGAYTLTGSAAAFLAPVTLTVAVGGYALTGSDATFQIAGADFTLFCGSGNYVLTGADAAFLGAELPPQPQPSPGGGYVGAWSGPKRRKRKRDEIEELIDAVIQAPVPIATPGPSVALPPPPALINMTAKMQAVGLTPPQRRTVKRAIVSDDEDDDEEAIELLLNLLS